jgi:hypothetical protein
MTNTCVVATIAEAFNNVGNTYSAAEGNDDLRKYEDELTTAQLRLREAAATLPTNSDAGAIFQLEEVIGYFALLNSPPDEDELIKNAIQSVVTYLQARNVAEAA